MVVNPVNVMLTPPEVAFVLKDCGSAAVPAAGEKMTALRAAGIDAAGFVLDGEGSDGLGALLGTALQTHGPDIDPDSLCTIGCTSGTTGHPKGAMQSQRAVLYNCTLTATMHGRSDRDVVVTALPAPHVYGNVAINGTFLAGGTVVLMRRFSPGEALGLIGEHRATMFEGVPAMYAMMLAAPELAGAGLGSLRVCTVGGQTIPVATVEAWQRRSGASLLELWGLPGSIGVALPGIEVRVADLADVTRDAPRGEPGELMVRGPIVMMGYFGNEAETRAVIEADGWLHTGDIAYADATGHFFVVDRRQDLIITAGYNVYPAEIERVLTGHPAVALVGSARCPTR
jgi:long-chain acyl-CoA synthetase